MYTVCVDELRLHSMQAFIEESGKQIRNAVEIKYRALLPVRSFGMMVK